jgi:hypothetical protein
LLVRMHVEPNLRNDSSIRPTGVSIDTQKNEEVDGESVNDRPRFGGAGAPKGEGGRSAEPSAA